MLKEVKGNAITEVPIVLCGNKKDEESVRIGRRKNKTVRNLQKREVSKALGEKLAGQWGTGFIETSAKNNDNITELFEQLLAREKKRQLTLTMDDEGKGKGKKKKCIVM